MKHNHNIDFFSSPHRRLIPFSEIKHPYNDINHIQDDYDQQKNNIRKSSFNSSYQPIKPFNINFFNQKLSEHNDEQQSMSQNDYLFQQLRIKSQVNIQIQQQNSQQQQYDGQDQNIENNQKSSQHKEQQQQQQDLYATPKKKNTNINSKVFQHTTMQKQKLFSRSNEKGLRKLSSLAFSIVNSSHATTYKQVAEELLSKLNFQPNNQMNQEESKMEKSSMQNVKRRVYDSLNVLIALGVIKRAGNKITKQKQKRSTSLTLNNGQFQQNQKYQQMIQNYQKHLINLQSKKKTQRQLRQKLDIFRKLIERNKKTKIITKNNKLIKFPFLTFINKNTVKQSHVKIVNNQHIELSYQNFPQSYGDLDFVRMLKNSESFQIENDSQC